MKQILFRSFRGSFTVEAAGVFSLVLFTVMILLNEAFAVCEETTGKFAVCEEAEYERHRTANIREKEITESGSGKNWSIKVTMPVFRPENSLRLWSLIEEVE